jgi:hypothetical protein
MRNRIRVGIVMAAIAAFAWAIPAAAAEPPSAGNEDRGIAQTEVEVQLVNVYGWISGGKLFLAGELRNTSRYHLSGWAQVQIKPGQGSATEIRLAYAAFRNVPPGWRTAFFHAGPFSHSSTTIVWANAAGYTEPSPDSAIGVSVAGLFYSDPGLGDTVRVEIRNTTARSIRVGMVSAVFRAANGRVSNVGKLLPPDLVILPGESAQVDVIAPPTGIHAVRAEVDALAGYAEEPFASVVSWEHWFHDIDSSSLKSSIAWVAEHGITAGCALHRYCPTAYVTRAQMAIFLVRAFDIPPATGPDHFSDDNGMTGESAINALFEAGITGGCMPGRFCPTAAVTRAQMAIFLVRALGLPAPTGDHFSDDNGLTGESQINSLYEAGVTGGCGPAKFCPKDPVTRAQMAAFLKRALALP